MAAIKYRKKRTGSSSLSSSETQATGCSLRSRQSQDDLRPEEVIRGQPVFAAEDA